MKRDLLKPGHVAVGRSLVIDLIMDDIQDSDDWDSFVSAGDHGDQNPSLRVYGTYKDCILVRLRDFRPLNMVGEFPPDELWLVKDGVVVEKHADPILRQELASDFEQMALQAEEVARALV